MYCVKSGVMPFAVLTEKMQGIPSFSFNSTGLKRWRIKLFLLRCVCTFKVVFLVDGFARVGIRLLSVSRMLG